MPAMQRSLRQKVVAAAAVALLLAGGALAAVSATGQSNSRKGASAQRAARGVSARDLAAASSYLGVSAAQISSELRSGKTLAQIAGASSGKSAEGLIEALVAARKVKLASAAAKLPQRVSAEVNRAGGPASGARRAGKRSAGGSSRIATLFSAPGRLGFAAAAYLGVAPAQLQADLRSGRTLAQVAGASAGRSKAGLVDALVAAKRQKLEKAIAAGRVPRARQAKLRSTLGKRMDALVQRQFAGGATA
jgi:hypothetical protein